GWDGDGDDIAGFQWAEGGSGRPADFTFSGNVSHDNVGHGALIWTNNEIVQPAYDDNQVWSNGGYGIHWGAYLNPFVFTNSVFTDNGLASVGAKAIPFNENNRLTNTTVDDISILAYVFIQEKVATFSNVTFTGNRPIGVTQIHDPCVNGDENDPADPDCLRVWLRFDNPHFPAGMKPFEFGQTFNKYSVWEVRGFSSPDYPSLPANFDLFRPDNTVAGGSYYAPFDAWLVPR
ncbi:MAG: hypothetical protein HOW73_44680, partial [Polyangiaceae bacterium]|nr:hypothetical protein [Polyangiaceae bacterium]